MKMLKNSEQENQEIGVERHCCKICNREFGCVGALGGHMRAHVMGDRLANPPLNDRNFMIKSKNNKHSYFLRAKTNRFMGCQLIEDGDYNKSSFQKLTMDDCEERTSSISTPSLSPRSKSANFDGYFGSKKEEEEEDLANCLVMLSNKSYVLSNDKEEIKAKEEEKGMFQCKTCKKVFNSHQALGGHRASHKKVKGCFATKFDGLKVDDDSISIQEHDDFLKPKATHHLITNSSPKSMPKTHECSVCHRFFSSGQALGGHKRCHWLISTCTDNSFVPNKFHLFQYEQIHPLNKKSMLTKSNNDHHPLDLNLNLQPQPTLQLENTSIDANIPNRFEASTRIYPNKLASTSTPNQNQSKIKNMHANNSETAHQMNLKKLSDLRDVNSDGGSSSWLRVGIASTADIY